MSTNPPHAVATTQIESLSDGPSPVGSATLNSDSFSINGVEIGEAHDDEVTGISVEVFEHAARADAPAPE